MTCNHCITVHKPIGINAHCDLPDGHAGPHLPVVEFREGCDKCKWEPHDLHKRELLLPAGYFECADCTAITEFTDPYKQLSIIKFRKDLCTDCFQLASEKRQQDAQAKVAQVTGDPNSRMISLLTEAIAPGDFDNMMSGASGYARTPVTPSDVGHAVHVIADDFKRPVYGDHDEYKRAIHGDPGDGGGVWVSMAPADPPGGKSFYANHIPGFDGVVNIKAGDIIHFDWSADLTEG